MRGGWRKKLGAELGLSSSRSASAPSGTSSRSSNGPGEASISVNALERGLQNNAEAVPQLSIFYESSPAADPNSPQNPDAPSTR